MCCHRWCRKKRIICFWLVDRNRFDRQFTINFFYFFYHSWKSLEHLLFNCSSNKFYSKAIRSLREIVVIKFDSFVRQNLCHESILSGGGHSKKKNFGESVWYNREVKTSWSSFDAQINFNRTNINAHKVHYKTNRQTNKRKRFARHFELKENQWRFSIFYSLL